VARPPHRGRRAGGSRRRRATSSATPDASAGAWPWAGARRRHVPGERAPASARAGASAPAAQRPAASVAARRCARRQIALATEHAAARAPGGARPSRERRPAGDGALSARGARVREHRRLADAPPRARPRRGVLGLGGGELELPSRSSRSAQVAR
jgi:hypothetical protein